MGGTSSGSASAGVRCLVRVEWPGAGSGGAAPAEPGAGSVMPQGLHGLPRQAGQAGESSCWAGVGVGCGVDGCGLMPAKPSGGMDLRVGRRWGGFLLRRDGETVDGATVGDEVFHRHHHRDDRDLSGNAASGHFGAEVGDFPEAV
jgi:hypothetical protein